MKEVSAIVLQGHQVASGRSLADRRFPEGTIRMQMPFFKERGVDLETYFGGDFVYGTLNLSVEPFTRTILKPAHYLLGIKWTDVLPAENFYLSEAQIVFKGRTSRAMIYIPDSKTKPDHFQKPSTIEVIAQTIPAIGYGDAVTLVYDPAAIAVG